MNRYDLNILNYIRLELSGSVDRDYISYENCQDFSSNRNYHFVHKDYDKIILVVYPFASGGNFLMNCLSLSDDVTSSLKSISEKIEFLNNSLSSQKKYWEDFIINDNFFTYSDIKKKKKEKYFFIKTHTLNKLKDQSTNFIDTTNNINYHLKNWKNCKKIIYIKNSRLFCNLRRCILKESIEYGLCEEIPLKIGDYFKLSDDKKELLKRLYNDKIKKYSYCDIKSKMEYYIWDATWYLSEEDTILNIKQFYDAIGLGGYDEKYLRNFYKLWMNTMIRLRKIEV
jgi:hypothetical protein